MVIYHVSFFIFITTIGLNIIFGIIVDTFSELRDLKEAEKKRKAEKMKQRRWQERHRKLILGMDRSDAGAISGDGGDFTSAGVREPRLGRLASLSRGNQQPKPGQSGAGLVRRGPSLTRRRFTTADTTVADRRADRQHGFLAVTPTPLSEQIRLASSIDLRRREESGDDLDSNSDNSDGSDTLGSMPRIGSRDVLDEASNADSSTPLFVSAAPLAVTIPKTAGPASSGPPDAAPFSVPFTATTVSSQSSAPSTSASTPSTAPVSGREQTPPPRVTPPVTGPLASAHLAPFSVPGMPVPAGHPATLEQSQPHPSTDIQSLLISNASTTPSSSSPPKTAQPAGIPVLPAPIPSPGAPRLTFPPVTTTARSMPSPPSFSAPASRAPPSPPSFSVPASQTPPSPPSRAPPSPPSFSVPASQTPPSPLFRAPPSPPVTTGGTTPSRRPSELSSGPLPPPPDVDQSPAEETLLLPPPTFPPPPPVLAPPSPPPPPFRPPPLSAEPKSWLQTSTTSRDADDDVTSDEDEEDETEYDFNTPPMSPTRDLDDGAGSDTLVWRSLSKSALGAGLPDINGFEHERKLTLFSFRQRDQRAQIGAGQERRERVVCVNLVERWLERYHMIAKLLIKQISATDTPDAAFLSPFHSVH
ncbi:hypothetical protein RRG08_064496 [Elysia crispata]|uniref:Uncharacterized protein n=1 Tax=Elysia crispata TaxID=231223 RepID=A0AAE1AGE7_9GAST|nr:hypothetical protein RRG08_064496 [Elysia crispata]